MKKFISILFIFSCILTFAVAAEKKQESRYVNIQKTEVKEKASNFAKVLQTLNYADVVTLISDDGKWAKVSLSNGKQGFITSSALTKRKIRQSGFSASAQELALAGKGFNEEIEKSYKQSNDSDFEQVDKMESNIIKKDDLLNFIKEGKLNGADGE